MLHNVIKNPLKFQNELNGLFLKIHHTKPSTSSSLTSEGGSSLEINEKRVRFLLADITNTNEAFAAFDEEDNIFIFHLSDKCYWQLPLDSKVQKCSAIKFVPQNKNYLLLGNKNGFIYEIEINSATVQRCIKAFFNPINQLLFSSLDPRMLLASSSNQIKIYEYENFQKKFEYARAHNDVKISFVKLIPTSDESCKVISVLKNDIICILSNSLRLIRHYDPLKARSKYLARFPHKMEKLNYCDSRPDEHIGVVGNEMKMNADNLIKSMTKDYSNGTVTDVSISSDGNHLIVSFLDNFIMLCSTSLWDVRRLINFDGLFVKQCDFIPFTTAESPRHKMLLTLASNDDLMLMSIKDLNAKTLLNMNNSANYVLATNGKILLNIQTTGEILAFNMEQCLTEASKNVTNCVTENATMSNSDLVKNETHQWKVEIGKMQTKINSTIPIGRLLPILKEFGSYPDTYRPLIWKSILNLPLNYANFARLVCLQLHSCVDNYQERFSLVDRKTLKCLIKVISCLAHWTPIFGYVNYLPKFVFPFLKVTAGDLLMCFEIVASLILNHCQLWFEFAPMQMPYNYFCLIENVLMESDAELFEFYKSKNVTGKIYAWPLMESAFSEVFDERQWYQLWDHIVSNEPYFMVFLIVAYNLVLRSVIMRTDDVNEIENVFHEQSYVESKKVIKRAYRLMANCPSQIHPGRFMKSYAPMSKNEYKKFQNYPKNVASEKVKEIDIIRAEQKALDEKLNEMESAEKAINSRLHNHLMDEEYSKRMREVELSYEKALDEEEERISCQRKKLLLSMRKIRERENEMMIQGRQSVLRKQLESRENELDEMLKKLNKQRSREEIELKFAEEKMKLKQVSLDNNNCFKSTPETDKLLSNRFHQTLQHLESQKHKLMNDLEAISLFEKNESLSEKIYNETAGKSDKTSFREDSSTLYEVVELENSFQKIQNDFLEAIKNDRDKADYMERMKTLEQASDALEKEIYDLLRNS